MKQYSTLEVIARTARFEAGVESKSEIVQEGGVLRKVGRIDCDEVFQISMTASRRVRSDEPFSMVADGNIGARGPTILFLYIKIGIGSAASTNWVGSCPLEREGEKATTQPINVIDQL